MKTDIELRVDILDELQWEPCVDAPEIGVSVEDGIVTLTGSVISNSEKWAAEKAALRVSGVLAVFNNIEVKFPAESRCPDEEIARSAMDAMEQDAALPEDVQVTVVDGWVTLSGKVELQYQKTAAQNAVAHLTGVKGVTNDIEVKPGIHLTASNEEAARSTGGGTDGEN